MINDVSGEVKKIMDEYEAEVEKITSDEIEAIAKETANELKNTSPRRTGQYAGGWAIRQERGTGVANFVVYNRKKPQLTHLLENGHVIRNKKGTYGRTDGISHIAPAEQKAADMLVEKLESKL